MTAIATQSSLTQSPLTQTALSQMIAQLDMRRTAEQAFVRAPIMAMGHLEEAFSVLAAQAETERSGRPGTMPPPSMVLDPKSRFEQARRQGQGGYATEQNGLNERAFFRRLRSDRGRPTALANRLLQKDPELRSELERQIGARIVPGASTRGAIAMYETGTTQSAFSAGSSGASMTLADMFGAMDAAILNQASAIGALSTSSTAGGGGAYLSMLDTGLSNILSGMSGAGFGSANSLAMPGVLQNTNPIYETTHQAEVASVLADPSLTVEDKVTLMLMLISQKMDDDIERQAQYINSIQQQQANTSTSAKAGTKSGGALSPAGSAKGSTVGALTGTTGTTGSDSSPSIDVETMKLQRMVTKRQQMFDMLRQIIDKYNETAKGIIQSIGR